MTWHWSAAVGFALASCGGSGRAVPAEVEIEWPDAATASPPVASESTVDAADAGSLLPASSSAPVLDAAPPPSE